MALVKTWRLQTEYFLLWNSSELTQISRVFYLSWLINFESIETIIYFFACESFV